MERPYWEKIRKILLCSSYAYSFHHGSISQMDVKVCWSGELLPIKFRQRHWFSLPLMTGEVSVPISSLRIITRTFAKLFKGVYENWLRVAVFLCSPWVWTVGSFPSIDHRAPSLVRHLGQAPAALSIHHRPNEACLAWKNYLFSIHSLFKYIGCDDFCDPKTADQLEKVQVLINWAFAHSNIWNVHIHYFSEKLGPMFFSLIYPVKSETHIYDHHDFSKSLSLDIAPYTLLHQWYNSFG